MEFYQKKVVSQPPPLVQASIFSFIAIIILRRPTVVDAVLWAFGARAQKLRAKKSLDLVNDVVARDCYGESGRSNSKGAPICSVSMTFKTCGDQEQTGTVQLTRSISLLGNAKPKFTESRFVTDLRWFRHAPVLCGCGRIEFCFPLIRAQGWNAHCPAIRSHHLEKSINHSWVIFLNGTYVRNKLNGTQHWTDICPCILWLWQTFRYHI